MMIVIDTSVLIDALHRKEDAIRKILELEEAGESLCTTQANVLEFYKGAYSIQPHKVGKRIEKRLIAISSG